jgi:SNF2 family DNA or RNA helicase
MVTSPESIQRFLDWVPEPAPDVQGMSDDELYALIYSTTGVEFKPKTKPRQHQLASVAFAAAQRRALFFIGVRLGKTATTLYLKEHLQRAGLSKKGIIICPNPILRPVWVHEAAKHSDLRIKDVNTKSSEFLNALEQDYDLIVVSWSSLQYIFTEKKKDRKGLMKQYADVKTIELAAEFFDFVAIDEIHTAKNHTTLRFAIGSHLCAKAEYRLGLTGTPFSKDPYGLWALAYLMDNGEALSRSYYFFQQAFGKQVPNWRANSYKEQQKAKFTKVQPAQFEWVFDKENKTDILLHKMQPMVLVYENTDIKEQIEPNVVVLEMAPEQNAAYKKVIAAALEKRKDEDAVPDHVYTKLRMISSGYLKFQDDAGAARIVEFATNPKMDWIEELLESCPGLRAIFYYMYDHTGVLLCRLCTKLKISHSWMHGGITSQKQYKAIADFQTGKAQVLVINALSGNAGIDLSVADYQGYVESPSDGIQRAQSEARALGSARGSRQLMMDDIIVSTVERRVLENVKEGRDLLQSMIFDPSELL